jgi:antitoxin component YwqK of YwqJK toxin-antitoxin module
MEGDSTNGSVTAWYESGKIMWNGYVKKSYPDSLYNFYYENGNLKLTGYFKDRRKDSLWTTYDDSGRMVHSELIRKQWPVIRHDISYHRSNQKSEEIILSMYGSPTDSSNLKVNRNWWIWYDNGQLACEVHFVNGQIKEEHYWSTKGKTISREKWDRISGKMKKKNDEPKR